MPKLSKEIDVFEAHADFCRVFSDAKRIRIMWFLGHRERSVSEIAEHLEVTMQNASQHLRVMRDKGLVSFTKKGQTVFYRISNKRFLEAAKLIRKGLVEQFRRLGYAVDAEVKE